VSNTPEHAGVTNREKGAIRSLPYVTLKRGVRLELGARIGAGSEANTIGASGLFLPLARRGLAFGDDTGGGLVGDMDAA